MPLTKNPFVRYQILDRCFSNPGREYFLGDLLEECNNALSESGNLGISRRQLFDDIKFMESAQGWSIPLERHQISKRVYYRYSDPVYSINKQPLNEMEANFLKSALEILTKLEGLPQFEWVYQMIPQMEQAISYVNSDSPIMSFENNEYLKGAEYLGGLFNAIVYKKVLNVAYRSFRTQILEQIRVHPYYLKQYNNRWYLYGLRESDKELINLALDRFESAKPVLGNYIENNNVDFREYFEDIVGVTRLDTEMETVELRVAPNLAPYIETKPLHGSQRKLSKDEEGLVIELKVIPNFELESLILSFGESIRVIRPVSLCSKIKDRVKACISNYEE